MEVAPVVICLVSESPVIRHSVMAGGVAHTPDSSPTKFDDVCSRDVINCI